METSRPITILHVVLTLDPGGLENGIVNVTRGLSPHRFRVDVCCLQHRGAFADRLPENSQVYVLGKGEGFSASAVGRLANVIERIKPDVIHTHNLGNLIYGSLATCLGFRCPILHSEHGELGRDELSRKRLLQRRLFYRSCRVIHTVSDGLRQHLIDLGFPAAKIRSVVNGVDTVRHRPRTAQEARRALGLDERGPVLGIVGRFIPSKRHDVLLNAFEDLSHDWPDAQLLLVGAGGSEYERITALTNQSSHASRIHLAGFQENPSPYYQAMDLLVLPSLIEGMSNVVLEAMACGVPVLSHNACGTAEILVDDENGFVRNLDTAERLLDHLRSILAAPERLHAVRQNARTTVTERFTLARMVRQYEELYLETSRRRTGFKTSAASRACVSRRKP